jgi:hypothetical protein
MLKQETLVEGVLVAVHAEGAKRGCSNIRSLRGSIVQVYICCQDCHTARQRNDGAVDGYRAASVKDVYEYGCSHGHLIIRILIDDAIPWVEVLLEGWSSSLQEAYFYEYV